MSGGSLHVRVLGDFELTVDGRRVTVATQAQRVIACLAVAGTALLRDTLAGRLWPDSSQARAQANLRNALWRLRQVNGRLVRSSRDVVGLHEDVDVDLARSERCARAVVYGDDDGAACEAPLELLERDLLPAWDEDWIVLERERVRQLRIHALEALSRCCTGDGRFARAVEAGLAAVTADPLRESANAVLIEAHLAEGNRSEAARQLATYRMLLAEELGLTPSQRIDGLLAALGGRDGDGAVTRVGTVRQTDIGRHGRRRRGPALLIVRPDDEPTARAPWRS